MLDVEPKDFALEIAGSDLLFNTYPISDLTLRCIPNFDMFAVESHNAGTITQEAYFSFMVLSSDERLYGISEGLTCYLSDSIYWYHFVLIDSPKPDMTGWSILKANYIGKEYV